MKWQLLKFDELSLQQLYNILALREKVFIIEQNCLEPDIDYQDQEALHLLGLEADKLIAYVRLLPPSAIKQNYFKFGRVLIDMQSRAKGLGTEAIQRVLDYAAEHYSNAPIHISAQARLEKYYEKFGFVTASEPYDESGIMHIRMIKQMKVNEYLR